MQNIIIIGAGGHSRSVIDILESENIHICINDQNSGCILLGDSDKNSVFVIMPMRV